MNARNALFWFPYNIFAAATRLLLAVGLSRQLVASPLATWMNYADEQEMELQALEAIYAGDFKQVGDAAGDFEITLVPEAGADEETNHVSIALHVTYTPTYPETAPTLGVRPVRMGGLTDPLLDECAALLREAAESEECLGTAMVYALVEKATEWLVEHNSPEMDMHTEMMMRLKAERGDAPEGEGEGEDEDDAAVQPAAGKGGRGGRGGGKRGRGGGGGSGGPVGSWRADPAEAAAAGEDYTPVTPESFAEWRLEWDAARLASKRAALEARAKSGGGAKSAAEGELTGRMIFESAGASEGASMLLADAGELLDGEEDEMLGARDGAAAAGAAAGQADAGPSALLDEVGDEDLFDEDEELPEV